MGSLHKNTLQLSRSFEPPTTFMGKPATASSLSPAQPESLSVLTDFSDAMVNDVPDLYFDPAYSATPPSAASSSMLPTPLNNWTPLPQSSPDVVGHGRMTFGDSFDHPQWPMPTSDQYSDHLPDQLLQLSSSNDYASSSSFKGDSLMADALARELDWKFQSSQQDYPLTSTESSHDNHFSHFKPLSTSLHTPTTYPPPPAIHDTPNHISQVNTASFSTQTSASASSSSAFTSPFNNTVSPSMLLLSGTSSSAFSLSSIAQPQAPLTLHQPKPSRKIPIVSLDKLASASESLLASKKSKNASIPLETQTRHPNTSLHPVTPSHHNILPAYLHTQQVQQHQVQSHLFALRQQPPMHNYHPTMPRQGDLSRVPMPLVSCNCGCNQLRKF